MSRLEELSRLAQKGAIFLVCYEGPLKAWPRRILMRIAEEFFSARVADKGVEP